MNHVVISKKFKVTKIKPCFFNTLFQWFYMSHERHTSKITTTRLFVQSLLRLTSKKTSSTVLLATGIPPVIRGFLPQRALNMESDSIPCKHDDVIKWQHFPRYWPFVQGIHRSPLNSPHKGQWRGALLFSLIYAWVNGWVNNREAGD